MDCNGFEKTALKSAGKVGWGARGPAPTMAADAGNNAIDEHLCYVASIGMGSCA